MEELQPRDADLSGWEFVAVLSLLGFLAGGLALVLPTRVFVVVLAVSSMGLVFYLSSVAIAYYDDQLPDWMTTVPVWTTFLFPFVVAFVLLRHFRIAIPITTLLLLFALLLVFFYYWLVVPLALYQRLREQSRTVAVDEWPALTVIVPAYNEEGYIGPTIEAFLEADYPVGKREIVVVDDGSTDATFAEARAYESGFVSVFSKGNGGKHSALNYGLEHVDTDLVVTVDADSVVAPDALKGLIRSLEANPDAGAIAGNVKVSNRGTHVTKLQALEYVIGISTFRRVLDLLGVVTVVPGCLGLFRREAIETVGGYSEETLTEDFDLTVALLKRGISIHHSNAIVYTEAPDTWRDLYRQRLRWFRGNLQTAVKHRRIFFSSEFGMVYRVAGPYLLFTMSVIPGLGILVFGLIIWFVVQGFLFDFLGMLGLFMCLQVLLSLLALRIENEDLHLAWYAPLSILGYKQFLDAILTKSVLDLLRPNDLKWTSADRVRQRD